jgi:hypothetical protein
MEDIQHIDEFLPIDRLGAVSVLIILLLAMVLYFCYKININNRNNDK